MTEPHDPVRRAASLYQRHFGVEPRAVATAPGRVNLLGEHTDYNDGWVMPMAVQFLTAAAVGPGEERWFEVVAETESAPFLSSIDFLKPNPDNGWANYPAGVVTGLMGSLPAPSPLRIAVAGDVPVGAGLSSSAALEVAVAVACAELWKIETSPLDIAKICQTAEHEFAGVPCGLMDQAASVLGREGQVVMMDCRSLEFEHYRLPHDHVVLIVDSCLPRRLSDSAYQERRQQCQDGVEALEALSDTPLAALRDVDIEMFARYSEQLDPVVAARCRHVVTENTRVIDGREALADGDAKSFGRLMTASHESLRDDYGVSVAALDTLVDLALVQPGCLGARLTGAGFGGCIIALMEKDSAERAAEAVLAGYLEARGIEGRHWIASPSDGATVVTETPKTD